MRFLIITLILIPLVGCGSSDTTTKKTPPVSPKTDNAGATGQTSKSEHTVSQEKQSAAEEQTPATLAGRITLDGELPGPRKLTINKDVDVCGVLETVQDVRGTDGGVADVVIEIKGVEGSDWPWKDPDDGYVIRQKDCMFVPSLIVIPNGKDISVYNDDPIGHNVNTGQWNQMQPAGPDPIVRPVSGKSPIRIGCNIHSWMEGWIYPAQTPFYAVTGETGEYSIDAVPPGKYRVMIWHPLLGRTTERVTLKSGDAATLDHAFEIK